MQRPGTSVYRVTITRGDGEKVYLKPGAQGEHDLINEVIDEAKAAGIGSFRTEDRVERVLRAAFAKVLYRIKSDVIPR